jgi:hypothetical protein
MSEHDTYDAIQLLELFELTENCPRIFLKRHIDLKQLIKNNHIKKKSPIFVLIPLSSLCLHSSLLYDFIRLQHSQLCHSFPSLDMN